MPKRNKRACIVVPSLYLVIHAEDITYDNNKSCSNDWNPTINFDLLKSYERILMISGIMRYHSRYYDIKNISEYFITS